MPARGTVAAQKQRKRKAERSRECGSEFTQGMLFQRQGQRGSKRAAMHWWDRERKLREGQISYVRGAGPRSYIGLYQRGWSHPIRGCVGAVGALCNFVRPTSPTPLHAGQKGQITARSGAQVGSIGSVLFSTALYWCSANMAAYCGTCSYES